MSDTALLQTVRVVRRRRIGLWVVVAAAALLILLGPFMLPAFLLQLGFTICALSISVIGLTVVSRAGQMTLAQPFFMMAGALTYVVVSSPADPEGTLVGLGLPPFVGMICGILFAGAIGLLFTLISSRLNGIYLGLASVGLVLLGQHIFHNAEPLSGGLNGRRVPDFEVFGLVMGRSADPPLILGTAFQRQQWLWIVGIIVIVLVALFALNVLRSRPGRALTVVESGYLTASVVGVNVAAYKRRAFLFASLCAGLSGVLYALAVSNISADSFDLDFALMMFAMVVIGGLGTIGGAIAGTAFVIGLPVILQPLLGNIPGLGSGNVSIIAQYVFGLSIIAVLLFWPNGLAGIWSSAAATLQRRRTPPLTDSTPQHSKE